MFHIYTDGACRNNQSAEKRTAAWAFVVFDQNMQRKGSKSAFLGNATNNEAELRAMIEALTWCKDRNACLYTDSQYVFSGMTEWMKGWQSRGWRTASNSPVKNLELWKQLASAYKPEFHTIHKVKGHSGDVGNASVDALCNVVLDDNNKPEWL